MEVKREKELPEGEKKKRPRSEDGFGYDRRLSARVDQKHIDFLDRVAKKHGETRNEVVRKMIDQFRKAMGDQA